MRIDALDRRLSLWLRAGVTAPALHTMTSAVIMLSWRHLELQGNHSP